MKKTFLYLSIIALVGMQSCEKKDSPGDNYDFTNSLAPYVALSSTAAKTVRQGTATTFTFTLRTALQQAVTVTYNVVGGGVNLTNQTVVIDRDKVSSIATVNIPTVIVAPATTATATLTVVKAVTADGTVLTLGARNNPTSQVVTLNITL